MNQSSKPIFRRLRHAAFAVCACLLLVCEWAVAGKHVQVSASTHGFVGEYGLETETFTWANQLAVQYRHDQWRLRLSQPYILQDGPAELVLVEEGEDDEFRIVGSDQREQRSGLGDPVASFSYSWPEHKPGLYRMNKGQWSAGVRWKFPRADQNEGFSNGRHEYTFSLSRSQRFDNFMLHGRIGRHFRQYDEESDNTTRNQLALGTVFFPGKYSSLGLSFYHKDATASQSENVRSLSLNSQTRINRNWRIGANIGHGLTETAANISAGLELSYRWYIR